MTPKLPYCPRPTDEALIRDLWGRCDSIGAVMWAFEARTGTRVDRTTVFRLRPKAERRIAP